MFAKTVLIFCYFITIISSLNAQNLTFIDKNSKINGFAEKQWFLENIPFIELPDKEIEDVYYYRWSTLKRHLRYIAPGAGYMMTEFVNDVFYSAKFGVINAAGGHAIYESRWLRDQTYVKNYINMYARQIDVPANHQYSEWIADSAYNTYLVNGDTKFITSQLDGFVKAYNDWSDHFEPKLGLYHITPAADAQERSAASMQTKDQFGGGDGYRPSHNSEMYGNAEAIVKIAKLAANEKIVTEFEAKAKALRDSINKYLWDPKRNFYYHVQRENNPDHLLLDTREEVGLYPWRFGVPDDRYNYSLALDQLFDAQGLGTSYGPATCETRSKWYDGKQQHQCCWWNGNSWPYSTAHVLRSVAQHIRDYSHQNPKITSESYTSLLRTYALTQYKDNVPYVAECHSPGGNFWVGDSRNHSEHYCHSTNNDNVLAELIGILPQEGTQIIIDPLIPSTWNYFAVEDILYHGHNISIIYDKNGDKYKIGKGLTVYVNGVKAKNIEKLGRISVPLPCFTDEPTGIRIENYATNYNGKGYPIVSASFSDYNPGTPNQAIDGRIFYDSIPSNRWTNFGSKHTTDWLVLDFGRNKTFNSIDLYVFSDVVTKEGTTDCPTKMVVQYWTDTKEWKDADNQVASPSLCAPNDRNRITFKAIKTSQLRVVFTRNVAKDYYIGVTEVQVWAEWPQTPNPNTYEVEDGLITEAQIEYSPSASGQSYVGLIDKKESNVELSGISVPNSADYKLRVFYANAESVNGTHNLLVNQLHNVLVSYPPTHSGWGHFDDKTYVELTVPLLVGDNVLVFQHKDSFAELDKIQLIF